MAPKPLEPGDPRRLGRFELLGRVGEGGQGVVYLGRGTGPGEERVAVKVLRSSVDPMVLERLGRELDAVHQVQPFVTAGVIEASAEGDLRYIVSEYIDGPSLAERVLANGPLREGELQRLAVGTATALTAIHGAGVVHRDFKPANVLLGPDGPRVVDFGIARLTDSSTMTSGVIGTPSYMAPEQLAGERPTSAVDVWAWGVTMVFAAAGRSAFGADTVPAVMHRIMYSDPDITGVPASLLPAVRACLEKDPQRRPSARDLMLRLVDPSMPLPTAGAQLPARAAEGAPTAAYHPGPPYIAPLPSDQIHTDPLRYPAGPAYPVGPAYPAGPAYPVGPAYPAGPVPGTPASAFLQDGPPTPVGPPARAVRSRRGLVVAASAGAVVAAAIVAGVLLLAREPSTSKAAGTVTSTTSSSAPASVPPTTAPASTIAPATGATIPAAFAGTWTGTAMLSAIGVQGIGIANPITFTFVAGATTIAETDQTCANTLTLIGTTATVLTFNEPQNTQCVAGTVTFTRHGADLAYRWTDNIEQNTAVLHKT
ncbi:MAG TPA: protein kinase [Streptosporangiaceae bacterium]|nr:protein kinase [Streptosporangiaceae bacterium]